MKNFVLTNAESKLAGIVWDNAPLASPELVALAERGLEWKKSTTYTILKKLCDKGVFKNENANITVLLSREDLAARQSRHFIEDAFGGSLPRFIASFFDGKKLSREQAAELKQLIEEYEGGGENAN